MPKKPKPNPDDRTGTVRFVLCAYAIRAGRNVSYYCCTQGDVMSSGKFPLMTIKDGDNYLRSANLGAVLTELESSDFSFERQKKKEALAEKILKPCVDCKFWKIKKEDLSKKVF